VRYGTKGINALLLPATRGLQRAYLVLLASQMRSHCMHFSAKLLFKFGLLGTVIGSQRIYLRPLLIQLCLQGHAFQLELVVHGDHLGRQRMDVHVGDGRGAARHAGYEEGHGEGHFHLASHPQLAYCCPDD
jgi:hypothetical protein